MKPDANPYAPPRSEDAPPPAMPGDRDAQLRHEYLGAILLAAASGALATVMLLASQREPTSDLGELATLLCRLVAFTLAAVSLVFVGITFRAAVARVWLLLGRIRKRRR